MNGPAWHFIIPVFVVLLLMLCNNLGCYYYYYQVSDPEAREASYRQVHPIRQI
jgi:hypothetical protein